MFTGIHRSYSAVVVVALLGITGSLRATSGEAEVMECLQSKAGITVEEATETMTAEEILSHRPFIPTDVELFNPSIYPNASEMQPAVGQEPTEAEVLGMLRNYLELEFPNDPQAQQEALDLFNDASAIAKVPSPTLRAGMIALRGTLAEAAIEAILHGEPRFDSVRFNDDMPSNAFGWVPDTAPLRIELNGFGRADSPFMFTRTLAHETLHSDDFNGVYEEGILTTLDTLVYLEQLSRHPELAEMGTILARFHNSNALARLNSGTGSNLGLYETNDGSPIFPCSPTIRFENFWARYQDNQVFEESPGNELLGRYLQRLQEPDKPVCSADRFDQTLVDCIDQNQNAVTDQELVAAAVALKLALPLK